MTQARIHRNHIVVTALALTLIEVADLAGQQASCLPDVLTDHPYVAASHDEQRLDFTWVRGAAATVLFIHGGSLFETGERRTAEAYRRVCDPIVGAGIACASMDYRLAPTFKWPAMPRDVASAVAAVRVLVRERGGNPTSWSFPAPTCRASKGSSTRTAKCCGSYLLSFATQLA